MFSLKSNLDLKMFLAYEKCDLIKFAWWIFSRENFVNIIRNGETLS